MSTTGANPPDPNWPQADYAEQNIRRMREQNYHGASYYDRSDGSAIWGLIGVAIFAAGGMILIGLIHLIKLIF